VSASSRNSRCPGWIRPAFAPRSSRRVRAIVPRETEHDCYAPDAPEAKPERAPPSARARVGAAATGADERAGRTACGIGRSGDPCQNRSAERSRPAAAVAGVRRLKKDAEDSGREASVVRVRRTRVRARRDRGVRARVRETGSARIVSRARARRGTRRAVNPRGRAMRVHAVCRAFVPARSQTRVPSSRGDSSRRARGAWCSAYARYERCDASLTRVRSTLLCVRSGRASGARR